MNEARRLSDEHGATNFAADNLVVEFRQLCADELFVCSAVDANGRLTEHLALQRCAIHDTGMQPVQLAIELHEGRDVLDVDLRAHPQQRVMMAHWLLLGDERCITRPS
jgi:hypothetical protein